MVWDWLGGRLEECTGWFGIGWVVCLRRVYRLVWDWLDGMLEVGTQVGDWLDGVLEVGIKVGLELVRW